MMLEGGEVHTHPDSRARPGSSRELRERRSSEAALSCTFWGSYSVIHPLYFLLLLFSQSPVLGFAVLGTI